MGGKRKGIEVSLAIAEAVGQANADVIAAYPITPQTHIVEHLSELVANGELDAEFVPVESEHSAMSVCWSEDLYKHKFSGAGIDVRDIFYCLFYEVANGDGPCKQVFIRSSFHLE